MQTENRSEKFVYSLFSLTLIILAILIWYKLTDSYITLGSDFTQDYLAGYALLHKMPIYGKSIPELSLNLLAIPGIDNFHPPTAAVFFAPLSMLNYPEAVWIYGGIIFSIYSIILLTLVHYFEMGDRKLIYFIPLLFFWYPFIYLAATQQISIFITALLIFGWIALEKSFDRLGGLLFGMAAALKIFPGFLLLMLVLKKRHTAAFCMFLTILISFGITFLIVGKNDFCEYFLNVVNRNTLEWTDFPINISLWSGWDTIFHRGHFSYPLYESSVCAKVFSIISCLVLIFFLLKKVCKQGRKSNILLSDLTSFLAVMVLISPISWSHIFGIFLPYFFWVTVNFKDLSRFEKLNFLLAFILMSLPDVYIGNCIQGAFTPGSAPPWYIGLIAKSGLWGLLFLLQTESDKFKFYQSGKQKFL